MGAAWCFAMEGWRGGFAAERNLFGRQRFLWKAGGFLGACPLCRWVLLGAWGGKGDAAASLWGGIPPTAAPPPPFHKGGNGLRRAVHWGSGRVLEALARFVDGCKLEALGWRGDTAGESFRRTAFLGSGRVLEALARFVDGCCLVLGEGRVARWLCCGVESLRRLRRHLPFKREAVGPAGDAFGGKRVGAGGACPLCRWMLLTA